MEVKRKTSANVIVQHEDGNVENIPLSPKNRLLFEHNLWGLLREGNEILKMDTDPLLTIIPRESGGGFTLKIEDAQPLQIGTSLRSEFVEQLFEVYDNDGKEGKNPNALINFRDEVLDNRVRPEVVKYLGSMPPFSTLVDNDMLKIVEDGWLFYGDLLLTWQQKFQRPQSQSTKVAGGIVEESVRDKAFNMKFNRNMERKTIQIDNRDYLLTQNEMEFLTRAVWATEVPAQ